jgi:hypothetical protein
MSYPVPILVMAFNRLEPAAGLMEILRQLRPIRLYLAFDGPRLERLGEADRCKAVRNLFRDGIDWPCEVSWLLRDRNLGCRQAVSTAIDWFFETEAEGVILEDDIHPIPSFFAYCADLLERYRFDARIGVIAGNNHQLEPPLGGASYYYSIYSHCWGWATWRRAWLAYHQAETLWPAFRDQRCLRQIGGSAFERRWRFLIEQVVRGQVDTWDILWQLACWQQGFLTCLPASEQVRNVGFDHDATHTLDEYSPLKSPQELARPLVHPLIRLPSWHFDRVTFDRLYRRRLSTAMKRKSLKLLRILGWR